MAAAVQQLSPVDTSLVSNPNYGSMTEYLITGTYYVVDNRAQIVYEFELNTPGNALTNTNGSYASFQAYLASQAPITVIPNPTSYPSSGIQNEQTVLLRGILLGISALAEQQSGGTITIPDLYPIQTQLA
jgi:hypothetical protein